MSFKLSSYQIKNLACNALKQLNVDNDYIREFKDHDTITMFINGAGYFIDEYTEDNLLQKIREVEQEYYGKVYAVIKNNRFGDTVYTFLWVSEKELEDSLLTDLGKSTHGFQTYETFVYSHNATYEYDSEFGYACIFGFYGGIKEDV